MLVIEDGQLLGQISYAVEFVELRSTLCCT